MADENKAVLKIAITHRQRPGGLLEAFAKTIAISSDGLLLFPSGTGTEIVDMKTGWKFVTTQTINTIGTAEGWYVASTSVLT